MGELLRRSGVHIFKTKGLHFRFGAGQVVVALRAAGILTKAQNRFRCWTLLTYLDVFLVFVLNWYLIVSHPGSHTLI